jgi:hypothetical protein
MAGRLACSKAPWSHKAGYFFLDFADFLVCFAGVFLDAPLLGVLRAIGIPPFGIALRDKRGVGDPSRVTGLPTQPSGGHGKAGML